MPPDRLFTDLYELTMMQACLDEGLTGEAAFSLFVRRLPRQRNYLVACGLAGVLDILESFRFGADDIAYLRSLSLFGETFLAYLADFRFAGDVYAVAEGSAVFANEPLLEVVAPLPVAQYFETLVMNQIHFQTLAASKASRVVSAAGGRRIIDFGARRIHGTEAALLAARAFHIAGVAATSNVAAGRAFGIPVAGTMGHSYVQAHDSEARAFLAFARRFPGTVLLVDTYDTVEGVRRVIDLARAHPGDFNVSGVRLDSGDLLTLSTEVRGLLDDAGLRQVEIIASGGLDEWEIAGLVARGAPIDGFGVGTAMGVSEDAPALDIAYKLTSYEGQGRMKLSASKATLPGQKQVFRRVEAGRALGDVIARHDETLPGEALLHCVMKDGRRTDAGRVPLDRSRSLAQQALAALPERLRALEPADPPYDVAISPALAAETAAVRRRIAGRQRP